MSLFLSAGQTYVQLRNAESLPDVFGFLIARWDLAKNTDLRRGLGPWRGRFSLGAEF